MRVESRGTATPARPTYVCIVRSEPRNGERLYSVTTFRDIDQVSSKRREQTVDIDEALHLVTSSLIEAST